jgi:2-keto-4-pentenoate hydratase/2-oxohepta-3-ene-1,7-dioic acid hydratase in catechol pathway
MVGAPGAPGREAPLRLLTFVAGPDGTPRVGLLQRQSEIIDLAEEARLRGRPAPFDTGDMVELVASGEPGLAFLREVAAAPRGRTLPLDRVRLLAPIHRPRKNVFCVGWNYLEHFAEGEKWRQAKQELPEHPVFFSKSAGAINGPFDPIACDPAVTRQLDWEAELGLVIGRRGKNIAEAQAMGHVFGYTVINDVSARDLQKAHGGQWLKGKSLDGACPMGPALVTADEVDPDDLRVICRVNGVVKQDSSTRHLYFKIPRLLAELSLGLTLEPGDVLSTGTPPGVGFGRTPPEFLAPGDVLETEIVGLGRMRNAIQG